MTSTRPSSRDQGPVVPHPPRQKLPVDSERANGWLWERERDPHDRLVSVLTIFLAGMECPFPCVYCDLWRQTLDGPTPPGAIPHQLDTVLAEAGPIPAGAGVKLYNASNFFDPRAVPPDDDRLIAARVDRFDRIVVESHPKLVGQRCVKFSEQVAGTLEVAIGLETADAEVLARLNKQMTLDDFSDAASTLRTVGISLRVFLLLPPPFVAEEDVVASVSRSAAYALEHGATQIALIPTRSLYARDRHVKDHLVTPRLEMIEEVLDRCRALGAPASVDLWDIDELVTCPTCGPARVERLRAINLSRRSTHRSERRIPCSVCMSSS